MGRHEKPQLAQMKHSILSNSERRHLKKSNEGHLSSSGEDRPPCWNQLMSPHVDEPQSADIP
jgi:hypothetical protein